MSKYTTHDEYRKDGWVDLSETNVDNDNKDDFLIDVLIIMNDNAEFQDMVDKPNFGREEVSEEQKGIKEADNVYTIKHFVHDNLRKLKKDKKLQKEIKTKLTRLKKIIEDGSTEYATILMLELQIDGMLDEGAGDND